MIKNINFRIDFIMTLAIIIVFIICSIPMRVNAAEISTDLNEEDLFYDGIEEKEGLYYYSTYAKNFHPKKDTGSYYTYFSTSYPIAYFWFNEKSESGWRICFLNNGEFKAGFLTEINFISKTYTGRDGNVTEMPLDYATYYYGINYRGGDILATSEWSYTSTAPIFKSSEDAEKYLRTMDDSLVSNKEPVTNVDFYLKNLKYKCYANDNSEHEEETFINFTWDTDNLKQGDLLEVKTRSYYKSLNGDIHIGFNDFITKSDNVSSYTGELKLSQMDATKAWWQTVENKPLIFKSYDTDIYFLRPVRGNILGGWIKISMGRKTPTSSPHVDNIEYGKFDENGEWVPDKNITDSEGGSHGFDQNGNITLPDNGFGDIDSVGDLFSYFYNLMKNLINNFGQLPGLITSTIGFLPNSMILIICGSMAVVILLRIMGR